MVDVSRVWHGARRGMGLGVKSRIVKKKGVWRVVIRCTHCPSEHHVKTGGMWEALWLATQLRGQ